MSHCDQSIGVRVVQELVSYLAYADDLVLLAGSREELQRQVNLVTAALSKCGLEVNPAKCATMSLVADLQRRLWYVSQNQPIHVNGEDLPSLSITDAYKYLGCQFSAHGATQSVMEKLEKQLENIEKAPLKPQQWLFILKSNVVPALYHQLVLAGVTLGSLDHIDRVIRQAIKRWLKLPHTTPDSYFYSNYKDSGLGIKCL